MPSGAERLLDTSVAVPLVIEDHAHHAAVRRAVEGRALGLAGHAAFETYSVLTRLPDHARLSPAAARRVIASAFPHTSFLDAEGQEAVLERLADAGVAGGAVYDALVGAAAAGHGVVLMTRDRRARDTYRAVGADVELLV